MTSPDHEQAAQFMNFLGDVNRPWQFYAEARPSTVRSEWRYHDSLEAAWPSVVSAQAHGGRASPQVLRADGAGRSAENVLEPCEFMIADCDHFLNPQSGVIKPGSELLEWMVRHFTIPPHCIVESGRDEFGSKFHAYWRSSIGTKLMWRRIVRGMSLLYDTDDKLSVCFIARVPGLFHLKEEPFQSRIVELTPNPETINEKRWAWAIELAGGFLPDLNPATKPVDLEFVDLNRADRYVTELIARKAARMTHERPDWGRIAAGFWIGGSLVERGITNASAVEVAADIFAEEARQVESDTGALKPMSFATARSRILHGFRKALAKKAGSEG